MDQHTSAFRALQQAGFPIPKVSGEEIDWKCRAFGRAPSHGHGPEQGAAGCDRFSESSPLCVAHYTLATTYASPGELTSSHQWRLGRAGISSTGGHCVGKVHPARFNPHQFFSRTRYWLRNVRGFKDLWPAESSDDDSFHKEKCSNCWFLQLLERSVKHIYFCAVRYILFALNVCPENRARSHRSFS